MFRLAIAFVSRGRDSDEHIGDGAIAPLGPVHLLADDRFWTRNSDP